MNIKILIPSILLIFLFSVSLIHPMKSKVSSFYTEYKIKAEQERIKKEEEEKLKLNISNTQNLIEQISEKITTNLVDNNFIKDIEVLEKDSWNQSIKVEFLSEDKLKVSSSGPDMQFDTLDDISVVGFKENQSGIKYYLKSLLSK